MVADVAHEDPLTIRIDTDGIRPAKLADSTAFAAPLQQKTTGLVEHTHTIVSRVGDEYAVVECADATGTVKLTQLTPAGSPREEERAGAVLSDRSLSSCRLASEGTDLLRCCS